MRDLIASHDRDTSITLDAQYFEYTSSANPIGARLISRVPYHTFLISKKQIDKSVLDLDLSEQLCCAYPATGPSLLAHFVYLKPGDKLALRPNATSQVFYVFFGSGIARQESDVIHFWQGDFFALPGGSETELVSDTPTCIYYVDDSPLLNYLGVEPSRRRFTPTLYPAERAQAELHKVIESPSAGKRNRMSILLGNSNFPQSRTITHSMWAMFGIVMPNSMQKPHRHQSIALDFIPECQEGVYTLVGTELDADGNIVNPVRVDWQPGMAFVTPPGYWHAHFNESNEPAYVIPLQDAGLQTYLRALDIRFAR